MIPDNDNNWYNAKSIQWDLPHFSTREKAISSIHKYDDLINKKKQSNDDLIIILTEV